MTGESQAPSQTPVVFVTPDPNAAFDPAALAEAVVDAETDATRQQAIVDALAGIGLGIYPGEGAAIVAGAERSATDFIVYDFEIAGLSGGIADGDEVYLDDLARELSIMNVSAGGDAFTAEVFATAVTAATTEAMANADEHLGYALRLARELGMRQPSPVDLAAPSGTEPIVLDPLAAFLVAADFSLPRILAAEPPAETAAAPTTGIVLAAFTAANPCTAFTRQVGAWHAGMARIPGAAGVNASFSRSLQARLVGGTVKVGSTYTPSWHRDHASAPGALAVPHEIALQVRAPVPPRVNCGPLRFGRSGAMLGGGAVVGADVTWTYPGLEDHAGVDCPASTCQRTDASGRARLQAFRKAELGQGGIGPEFKKTVDVTAEVNLFTALGLDLVAVLNLPPDMRVTAKKVMPTEISWHRAYEFSIAIDSQLYVRRVPAFEYPNHMGTATASGVLEAATIHPPNDVAAQPPKIGSLATITDKGLGPLCTTASSGAEGSITILQKRGSIDFQVIELVVDPGGPTGTISLYLDVGPADDYRDDRYRHVACHKGQIVADSTAPGTNLWEYIIFRGYPRGLSFEGYLGSNGGPTAQTQPNVWNLRASEQDWLGDSDFVVAVWETPQECGGYCDSTKSWLNMTILADPLPDP